MAGAVGAAVDRFAPRQHGLVGRRQLRVMGVSNAALEWACRSGQLVPYRYGVFRAVGAPPHPHQPALAACLAAGKGAVASHWCAASLHRLKGVAAGAVEISALRHAELGGVIVHRLAEPLSPLDRVLLDGVPVTTVARTLVDLASKDRLWLVERALDDALVRRLCTLGELYGAAERSSHRRGVGGMRRLLAARSELRTDSFQERRWLDALGRLMPLQPELHHRVAVPEGVFEIDIAFPPVKVGLEVNGWTAHGTRSAFDHDARKGLILLREGWRVGTLTSAMSEHEVIASVRTLLGLSLD